MAALDLRRGPGNLSIITRNRATRRSPISFGLKQASQAASPSSCISSDHGAQTEAISSGIKPWRIGPSPWSVAYNRHTPEGSNSYNPTNLKSSATSSSIGSDLVTPEKLDEWLRDSIAEIVREVGQAPFLMHMFAHGGTMVRLERETAASPEEVWSRITSRWDRGSRVPDGVVLVEELRRNGDQGEEETSSNRTWGLVVQGRGMDRAAAACYILSTCRVQSVAGFCTHFCLVRAKCFGEPIDMQLTRAWLQQGRRW